MEVAVAVAVGLVVGDAIRRVWLVDHGLDYTRAVERAYQTGRLGRPDKSHRLGDLLLTISRDTR